MSLSSSEKVLTIRGLGTTAAGDAASGTKAAGDAESELLLSHGALIEAKATDGNTPLHAAAFDGFEQLGKVLLSQRASIEAKAANGNTPLHVAASMGHEQLAKLLLSHRASIEAKAANGSTPLHRATSSGHEAVAQMLLRHGAAFKAKTTHGVFPHNAESGMKAGEDAEPLHPTIQRMVVGDRGDAESGRKVAGHAQSEDSTLKRMVEAWTSYCEDKDTTLALPNAKRHRGDAPSEAVFLHEARVSFSALMRWIATLEASKHPDLLEAVFPILILLFFRLLDVQLIEVAQSLLTEHGGIFAALSVDSRRTILFLRGFRTMDQKILENLYAQFWEGENQLRVKLPQRTYNELLEALKHQDLAKLRDMVLAVIEPERGDHQVKGTRQAVVEATDMKRDAHLINRTKLHIITDVVNPPMAYGKWQRVAPPMIQRQHKHSSSVHSAESIEGCGLPLPSSNSPERRLASKRFAKLAMKRDLVDPSHLPSTFDFFVGRGAAQEDVNCIAVSSDMKHCVAGNSLGAKLWHIGGPVSEDHSLQNHPCMLLSHVGGHGNSWILDAAFCPSDDLLLTASHTGTLALWIVRTAAKLAEFPVQRQSEPFWSVDWCPTGHYFVSSGCNGEGLLWSIDELEPLRVFKTPKTASLVGQQACPNTIVVKCHPSAQYVAVASNSSLVMWDLLNAQPARIFENSRNTTSLAFSKDGTLLAAGRSDGCIDIWNVATGQLQQELLNVHSGAVSVLDFSWPSDKSRRSDWSLLLSGGLDGDIHFWPTDSLCEFPVGRPVPQSASSLGTKSLGSAARLVSGVFTPANTLLIGRTS